MELIIQIKINKMALPNTNLSVAMVKAELGASTNDVGQLCIHPNINKWSRYKPYNMPYVSLRDGSNRIEHPTLGAILPMTQNQSVLSIKDDSWIYDKPLGGASSPYRLEDFGGYDNNISYADDFFGVKEVIDMGSNIGINCYFGGVKSTFSSPKYMPLFKDAYIGISIFGGAEIDNLTTHIFSMCGNSKISEANAELFTISKSILTGYNFIYIIPFVTEFKFTNSVTGAGSYKKYIINGYAPKKSSLFYSLNGSVSVQYLLRDFTFEWLSTIGFRVGATAVSQIDTDRAVMGSLYAGYKLYDAPDGQGNVILNRMWSNAPQVPSFTVPKFGNLVIPTVESSWGSGITPKSIEIRYRDMQTAVEYNSIYYNL